MPTPFEDWNRRYTTGQSPAAPGRPGPRKSMFDKRVEDAATRVLNRVAGGARAVERDVSEGARTVGRGFSNAYQQVTNAAPGAINQAGQMMSAAGRRAVAPLMAADAALRRAGETTEGAVRRFGTDVRERTGEIGQDIARGSRMMGEGFTGAAGQAGRMAVAPLRAADTALRQAGETAESAVRGFGSEMREGARTMGRGFAKAGRDIGGFLERINIGPQGPTWATFNAPGEAEPASASAAATSMPAKPESQASAVQPIEVKPKATEPVKTKGEVKPPQPITGAAKPFSSKPKRSEIKRYVDAYNATPEEKEKIIKGADLIQMIRGTKQTWGNPKIAGDLGIKEFNSPLEAAYGVEHESAMTKHAIETKAATELEKERIKGMPKREPFKVEKVTETDLEGMPQEILKVFDPNTGRIIESERDRAQAIIDNLDAGQISMEDFQQHYINASDAEKKRLRKVIEAINKSNK